MTERDSSKVGGTGGQGFLECSFSRNPDDSHKDDNIGDNDDHETANLIEHTNKQACQLAEGRIRTGCRDDGRVLTAKVVNDGRSTVGQCQKKIGEYGGTEPTP